MTLEELKAEALKLSPEEQARLIDELVAKLHGPVDGAIADAWYDEVSRRMEAFDRGEVEGVPAAQVMGKLKERLG